MRIVPDNPVVRQGVVAEELMQAFIYKHLVPTDEWLLSVIQGASYSLSCVEAGKVLEVKQGASVDVTVKAVRTEEAKGAITITGDELVKGMTVKRATIAADKDEAKVTITATRQLKVGFAQNVILAGTLKVGKESVKCFVRAIGVKIIDPKK